MNINALGQVVSGFGAGGVWVGTAQLVAPPAGKAAWLSNNLIVFQDGANQIAIVNTVGRVDVIDPRGATWIVAAAGDWAAFVADGRSGVRTSWGLVLPEAAALAMLPGVLIVRTSYQQGGISAYLVGETDPNKPIWSEPSALPVIRNDAPQFSALDAQRVIWADGAALLQSRGLPRPRQFGLAFDPFVLESSPGEIWIGYHNLDSQFVLHPLEDASRGCIVAVGDTFSTCGFVRDADTIECFWAPTAAENGNVQSRVVRLSTDANTRFVQAAPAPPPPTPQPIPAPPPAPAPTPVPTPGPIHMTPQSPRELDLNDTLLVNCPNDIASWPITTRLTKIEITPRGVHVEFGKQDGPGSWPDVRPPGWDGDVQYNLCLALNIGGHWYASPVLEFWRGRYGSDDDITRGDQIAKNWLYADAWGPMQHRQPQPGEMIGFFVVAGDWRYNQRVLSVRERSNVMLVPMPSVADASWTFNDQAPQPAPSPAPSPTPAPAPQPIPPPPTPAPAPSPEPTAPARQGPAMEYGPFLDAGAALDKQSIAVRRRRLTPQEFMHYGYRLQFESETWPLERCLADIKP